MRLAELLAHSLLLIVGIALLYPVAAVLGGLSPRQVVRGFAPAGWGPRDLTLGTNNDALGGSMYWAATYEIQTPLFFAPKDFGMRLALFADAGQLLDPRSSRDPRSCCRLACLPRNRASSDRE